MRWKEIDRNRNGTYLLVLGIYNASNGHFTGGFLSLSLSSSGSFCRWVFTKCHEIMCRFNHVKLVKCLALEYPQKSCKHNSQMSLAQIQTKQNFK